MSRGSREPFLFALAFVLLWAMLEIHARHRTTIGGLIAAVMLIVFCLWAGRLGAQILRRITSNGDATS